MVSDIERQDWECALADTRYSTHSIHRYSGKFIPQIAKNAIELLTVPGELVLDPYCGSGTTILEATLTGRRSIGLDLNPLGVLISKVKTTPILGRDLKTFQQAIIGKLKRLLSRPSNRQQFDLFDTSDTSEITLTFTHSNWRWHHPWYRKWFGERILEELIAIFKFVTAEPSADLRNIGMVAFSDILRQCSFAHGSYPNVMFDRRKKQAASAITPFIRRLDEVVRKIAEFSESLHDPWLPTVLRGDATNLPIDSNFVDAVVTHPPYIGSIPYAEYGLLSLSWLGHDPKVLDRLLTGGVRQSRDVVTRFEKAFQLMLSEVYRVLKKEGTLFMLLGNPVVKGKVIDLINMACDLSTACGFRILTVHNRNGMNRRANKMGSEGLLFFTKS